MNTSVLSGVADKSSILMAGTSHQASHQNPTGIVGYLQLVRGHRQRYWCRNQVCWCQCELQSAGQKRGNSWTQGVTALLPASGEDRNGQVLSKVYLGVGFLGTPCSDASPFGFKKCCKRDYVLPFGVLEAIPAPRPTGAEVIGYAAGLTIQLRPVSLLLDLMS